MAEYKNPFTIGRFKNVKGNAAIPMATNERTIVVFVPTTGDFDQVEGNEDIAKVYPKAKDLYRGWWRSQLKFKAGEFQATQIASDTEIAHLIALVEEDGEVGFEENALKGSIDKLGKHASYNRTNVHVNKCGTEEEWEVIMKLLDEYVAKRAVNVYIYE